MKMQWSWAVVGMLVALSTSGCRPGGDAGGGMVDAGADVSGVPDAKVALDPTGSAALDAVDPSRLAPDVRARMAADAFSQRLRGRLQSAMQQQGLEVAVEVCHSEAPVIAAEVMGAFDVRLGRVSTPGRNRHPGNAPEGWQAGVLEQFQRAVDAGADAGELEWVADAGELPDSVAVRQMYGLRTQQLCTTCHGATPQPEAAAAVARLYPADRAAGYSEGDLRGALWVEVLHPQQAR